MNTFSSNASPGMNLPGMKPDINPGAIATADKDKEKENEGKYPVFGVEGNPYVCLGNIRHGMLRKGPKGEKPIDCPTCAGPVGEIEARHYVAFFKQWSDQLDKEKKKKKRKDMKWRGLPEGLIITPIETSEEQEEEKSTVIPLTLDFIEDQIKKDKEKEKKEAEEKQRKEMEARMKARTVGGFR